MVPQPWLGFWKSLEQGIVKLLCTEIHFFNKAAAPRVEPWQRAATHRRAFLLTLTLALTACATWLFARLQINYQNGWLQYSQVALFCILSAWIMVGFSTALMGFVVLLRGDRYAMTAKSVENDSLSSQARTAVIMPICNEDTTTVFAGLRAIAESLAATKHTQTFDIYVLSDSRDPQIIAAERHAWEELRCALANRYQTPIQVYYRLRTRRVHRKAGNVADFCRRWGKNYRYMVVLDADSVMSGECLITLAKLMEANPTAGIIQTATQAVGQVTLHARVQQFASRVVGRVFTLGMQYWQLGESHYFGHNAIIRVEPFMKHCALAPIKGQGGLSGDIMSHDFVEAALMRRAGYHVWMVADLQGSYEQQPPDLLSELQRDRRWCQGNIQNSRIMAEPGIHGVHRAMFATGFMSYFSAPLWLAFLALGTCLQMHKAVFGGGEMIGLWAFTLAILFMPRLLGVLAVIIKGEQHYFGGTWSLICSSFLEATIALLQAPIRMVAHSLFVASALTGIQLEWKSPPREAAAVPWQTAFSHFALLILAATAALSFICYFDVEAIVWLLPVVLPLLLVVPVTVLTSQAKLGQQIRHYRLLLIPEEAFSPTVLRNAWKHIRLTIKGQPQTISQNIRFTL